MGGPPLLLAANAYEEVTITLFAVMVATFQMMYPRKGLSIPELF